MQIKLNGEEQRNVDNCKYLGSVIDNGDTNDRDMYLCVHAVRSRCRRLFGVFYGQKSPIRLKSKVYDVITY